MLNNIKSTYFIQILLSYINERNKLKLIKYNKSLQKIININIINYKSFSGRYIIYESNNFGKEYEGGTNLLIYEGEYLNGKRHGKGKEFWDNGNISFEGEYLNGKSNGKGKFYQVFGILRFEGEYLNNKQWIGTGYDDYGQIKYKLKNEINGKGKEYYWYNGKLFFEGDYLNGRKNGKGKEYYNNGKIKFEGEYFNNLKWTGKVYDLLNNNIVYELKDGKGFLKEYDDYYKFRYEGEYLNGLLNGKVKKYWYYYGDILIYEGEYLNGVRNGKGKEYNRYNGLLKFEGEYLYGNKLKGKDYLNGKLEYEGQFLFNKKWNGKGYDENGNIIYELINGKGKVKEYNDDILIYEGDYLNGQKHGKGKEYYDNGPLMFEGEFINGKRIEKNN